MRSLDLPSANQQSSLRSFTSISSQYVWYLCKLFYNSQKRDLSSSSLIPLDVTDSSAVLRILQYRLPLSRKLFIVQSKWNTQITYQTFPLLLGNPSISTLKVSLMRFFRLCNFRTRATRRGSLEKVPFSLFGQRLGGDEFPLCVPQLAKFPWFGHLYSRSLGLTHPACPPPIPLFPFPFNHL